jgi:signal transduction histidine kinase/CheY-like chemotaxis protein
MTGRDRTPGSRLLEPGVRLLAGLRFGRKFSLISVLLVLPLAVLVVAFTHQAAQDASLARDERAGLGAVRVGWAALSALGTPEGPGATARFAAVAAEARARGMLRDQGTVLSSVIGAEQATPQDLKLLIAEVVDGSRLILDPKLDTYYLMEVATIRLPRIVAMMKESEFRVGAGTPASDDVLRWTLASEVQRELKRVTRSIDIVEAGYPPAAARFAPLRDELERSIAAASSDALDETESAAVYATLRRVFDTSADLLDERLRARLARTITVAFAVIAGSMGFVLLAVYGLLALYASLRQSVVSLRETTERIQGGDMTAQASSHTQDELGEVAAAFNDLVRELRAQWTAASGEAKVRAAAEAALKRQTRELEFARDLARSASNAKSDFLANMSHEIRTPMTAILGYADLLLEPGVGEREHAEYIRTIRHNGAHLLALINDILDLSKIEAGQFRVESLPYAPREMLGAVESILRIKASEKGLAFSASVDPAVPAVVGGDALRLRQILINLAGNAVKFTERGSVEISCRPGETTGSLRFDVRDTGIGLTTDQIERVFRPFSQGDETMSRRFGGTGLGLAISKRLADLMGGGLTVASSPGEGSLFSLTVSAPTASAPHAPTAGPAIPPADADPSDRPLVGVRVLLAEDGPDNQRLIAFHLTRAGAHVRMVDNGADAVDAVLRQPDAFDVVFMDMQMPVMDGYAATAALRNAGLTIPVVALTAHALENERVRCLESGCNEFCTKPIDKQALIRAAARWGRTPASDRGVRSADVLRPGPR